MTACRHQCITEMATELPREVGGLYHRNIINEGVVKQISLIMFTSFKGRHQSWSYIVKINNIQVQENP